MKGIFLAAVVMGGIAGAVPARALELNAVVMPNCPLSEPDKPEIALEAMGIAMAANLAGHAVVALAERLSARLREARSYSRSGTFPIDGIFLGYSEGSTTGIKFAEHNQCLVIALADGFARPGKADPALDDMQKAFPTLAKVGGGHKEDLYDKLGLRSDPAFYAEFQVLGDAPEPSAFRLVPLFIHYPNWVEKGAKERDVSLLLEWSLPGQSNPYAAMQIVRANATPQSFEKDRVSSWASGWMPLPSAADLRAQTIKTGLRYRPVNLKVMFVETAKPGQLAQLFGKTLDDSKTDLAQLSRDSVTQALDASAKANAQVALVGAFATASKKYTDDYAVLIELKDKYDAEKSVSAKSLVEVRYMTQVAVLKADGEVAKQAAKSMGDQGAFTPLVPPALH